MILLSVNPLVMRFKHLILAALLFVTACRSGNFPNDAGYPAHVGDITPDSTQDDPGFTVCRETYIPQYYSIETGFEGEKPAIERHFRANFAKNKRWKGESGFITIRFVVNCRGQTGRFRMQEMGTDMKPKQFPRDLSGQLLELTRSLKGWRPGQSQIKALDYYQYLTFKIADGDIAEILP